MNNDGSKLRDAMGRHLDELQPATPIEHIRRRAQRGRLLMGASLVALVAFIGASGVFMLERFADDEVEQIVGPAPSPGGGLIAFVTQGPKDPMPWIATVPTSGGEVTRLHEGSHPSWSPDGTRIAFVCNRGICTMKADGSDVAQLTDPAAPAFDEEPDWGPGSFIAFTRNYMDGKTGRDILIVRQDGGPATPVIEEEANFAPAWSPDGRAIAFVRGIGDRLEAPEDGFQLWRMNADGSELVQLTEDGAFRADWSPDGETILFDRGSALWTIPADGGEPRKLPVVSGQGLDVGDFPTWAPDSRRIAFTCSSKGRDGNDICLADVDSEQWTALVATGENEASPAWQPVAGESIQEPTDCGQIELSTDEYGTEIEPTSGPPGTEVRFSGTTLRGEDGRWAPSDRLEAWWNTDTPASEVAGGTPVTDGPVVRLVRVDDMEQCRFETTFTVPDVAPGRYKISVFSWFADPQDGYGKFLPHHFTVTGD